MFDHVGVGVSEASKTFLLRALAPLGVGVVMEVPLPLHIAFSADDRRHVDEFYRQALAAGGKDNGPPGIRSHYHRPAA